VWAKNFNFGAKTGARSQRSINIMISLIWSYDSSLESLGNHKNSITKRPVFSDGTIHTSYFIFDGVGVFGQMGYFLVISSHPHLTVWDGGTPYLNGYEAQQSSLLCVSIHCFYSCFWL